MSWKYDKELIQTNTHEKQKFLHQNENVMVLVTFILYADIVVLKPLRSATCVKGLVSCILNY